jgi:hypothetical protein
VPCRRRRLQHDGLRKVQAVEFDALLGGQIFLGSESIVKESFSDAQNRPGAAMGFGVSATGATHNDPDPGSGDAIVHNIPTITTVKSFGFILEPHELLNPFS